MRKLLTIITLFLVFIKISAQSYEEIYLQSEKERLERVKNTEIDIENFTNSNINTFDFTDIINKVNQIKLENGKPLTGNEYQEALLYAKKERLRDYYFQINPEKISYYYAAVMKQCTNGGFEDGTSSGYTFTTKKFDGQNYNLPFNYNTNPLWVAFSNNPQNPFSPSPSNIATVVDNSILDPLVGIPRTNSGKYAIRINNSQNGDYDVTRMRRQFTVTQNSISFAFALVLQNADHLGENKNPYYQVILRDNSNNIIFQRNVVADPANTTLFSQQGDILYTRWLCERINTGRYVGQTVTLEITLADCGKGGHFGYGYFDDFCGTDCNSSSLDGNISLNPLKIEKCPTYPIPVSGNYTLPLGATFNSLQLEILDAATGNIVTTVSSPTTTVGGSFVFDLSSYDFYNGFINSIKKFNFRVRLLYSIGSIQYAMQATNTNPPGPDISFEGCELPCYEIIYIKEPTTSSQNLQAYTIESSSVIHPNLLIDYRAVLQVHLKEGFYASGHDIGVFHAYIAPCEQTEIPLQRNNLREPQKEISQTTIPESGIKVYPNPTVASINIDLGNEKLISWEIFDLSGKSTLKGKSTPINVQNILKGNYLLKINSDKKQYSKIIIVK